MFKITLFVLIAIVIPISAFAEPMMELGVSKPEIQPLDSIFIIGTITGVSDFKSVTLTVTSPDGKVVFAPSVEIKDGTFKRLIHPPLPSFKSGVYTVTASHPDMEKTTKIQFTVTDSSGSSISYTPDVSEKITTDKKSDGLLISAETVFGSNKIIVSGSTKNSSDITFRVTSPNGNLISVAQITPDAKGQFSTEIISGGVLWKENGMYTITANQGPSSEFKKSIQVEIDNGVVVPEFGTIAVMILAVAIISIIAVSAKSRLSIMPRY